MRKVLVTEIELPSCHHLRHIWFTLPNIIEKDGYRAITSYNAFFHGRKERNWRPHRRPRTHLYVAHMPDDIFDWTITPGVPHEEVSTIWDFYALIGYDYKTQKYQS